MYYVDSDNDKDSNMDSESEKEDSIIYEGSPNQKILKKKQKPIMVKKVANIIDFTNDQLLDNTLNFEANLSVTLSVRIFFAIFYDKVFI